MKAEIDELGALIIIPINNTEEFAINAWFEKHSNGCSVKMELDRRYDIGFEKRLRITLFHRIIFKIKLFFCR